MCLKAASQPTLLTHATLHAGTSADLLTCHESLGEHVAADECEAAEQPAIIELSRTPQTRVVSSSAVLGSLTWQVST